VVDVQDDALGAARATAVMTAEAVASEDPEAEPGGERIAGAQDTFLCQGASRT
jgi:hypothetical protein